MDFLLDDRSSEGTDLLKKKLQENKTSESDQPVGIFHLALGVMEFIEATLGFEPEVMAKAHQTLSGAESASVENAKYNVRYNLVTSYIYPPGTEFQVTHAESTLLNALLMLLQENNGVVESAKALYKLRKAYHTLDAVYKRIKDSEPIFNRNLSRLRKQSSKVFQNNSSVSSVDLPGLVDEKTSTLPPDFKLMKDLEAVFQMRKSRVEGTNLGNSIDPKKVNLFANFSATSSAASLTRKKSSLMTGHQRGVSPRAEANTAFRTDEAPATGADDDDSDDDEFSDALDTLDESADLTTSVTDPHYADSYGGASILTESSTERNDTYLHVSTIDEFIHSGVQLCFGILQVVLSLIPPTIGKVLAIVGFKGERDVGLRLLWRNAITCRNIHGDLALLCLLVFYDGPVQFVDQGFQLPEHTNANVSVIIDIGARTSISDSELDKILMNPDFYTPQLLDKARTIFPHNALWVLQQGRVLASHGQLKKAIEQMQGFTDDPNNKIQMQQAESLLVFDRGTFYCFDHEFDLAARDFLSLIDMSSWCKSAYLLMCGSSYAAKYRMIKMGLVEYDTEEEKAEKLKHYAQLAKKYIKLAPTYIPGHGANATGRKGGIGGGNKQLPFDKFVLRKYKQLEEREKQYPDVAFVDLMGTSIIHELMYFWNAYNRMGTKELLMAIKLLGYSGDEGTPYSEAGYAVIPETEDEAMIRYFLQSLCLRSLGEISTGLSVLDSHVISKFVVSDSPFKFNRLNYSPYLCPTVLYEKTMFVWLLKTSKPEFDVQDVANESKSWLKKASTISDTGDYELSNRTNMRIKAASEKLDQLAQTKR
ncbi:Mitochondrial outer membrane protein iml2 [Yamadazyma tenuis]|uniref:Mitochondrial outer membrane protein iml2 n=1 Tax=Candida tenuis TaxID=2315449 RepID=UPI0027A75F27|nr:Mitochondrial outer membrane protein iml2 [Yamadazyma tenuis]